MSKTKHLTVQKMPCPFCGSCALEPGFHIHPHQGSLVCVSCLDCHAEGPPTRVGMDSERATAEAYEKWNQRKPQQRKAG